MSIPKLRFKEFHENWIESRLSELALKITDGTHDTPIVQKEGMPFLTAINIKDGFINYHDINYVDETTHKKIFERCNPEKDDLLIVNIGAGTATCARNIVDYPFSLKNVALVKPNKKLLNPVFLEQFQRKNSAKLFVSLTSGGAQPFLSLKEIGKLVVKYSSLEEQTKIASFLSAVDEKISQLNQKHELLSQYKQGMMQKLFSQQIRFKADDGSEFEEWENLYIGDLCKITTGNKDTQNKVNNGAYPFFVRSQTVEQINSYSMDCEAVLTSGDGVGVGKNYHYINGKFDFHQRVYCLYNFSEIVLGKYLYIYFSSFFYDRVKRLSAKNSVDSVRMDMISKMQIQLPCLEEQIKISNFFSAIDQKIEVVAQQIEQANQWKKGLLQQMFV